ncbi:hypothetical protein M422DRAFT_29672 [Sphaerobolus stellatus SS14]|uniref:PB1 domain-containing protein n=1 Tax=Sphaerobolus stellatus (strain SS14) TaxID=990650 RepID=A0A0C9VSR2_SPHS4|nr:hypothetical protein M422DRAFT_29672 [Sphaerobolus stellatus SS14]
MPPLQVKLVLRGINPCTRRVTFKDEPSWIQLSEKVQHLFSIPISKAGVAYTDDDRDEIIASSEEELRDCFENISRGSGGIIKLFVCDVSALRAPTPSGSTLEELEEIEANHNDEVYHRLFGRPPSNGSSGSSGVLIDASDANSDEAEGERRSRSRTPSPIQLVPPIEPISPSYSRPSLPYVPAYSPLVRSRSVSPPVRHLPSPPVNSFFGLQPSRATSVPASQRAPSVVSSDGGHSPRDFSPSRLSSPAPSTVRSRAESPLRLWPLPPPQPESMPNCILPRLPSPPAAAPSSPEPLIQYESHPPMFSTCPSPPFGPLTNPTSPISPPLKPYSRPISALSLIDGRAEPELLKDMLARYTDPPSPRSSSLPIRCYDPYGGNFLEYEPEPEPEVNRNGFFGITRPTSLFSASSPPQHESPLLEGRERSCSWKHIPAHTIIQGSGRERSMSWERSPAPIIIQREALSRSRSTSRYRDDPIIVQRSRSRSRSRSRYRDDPMIISQARQRSRSYSRSRSPYRRYAPARSYLPGPPVIVSSTAVSPSQSPAPNPFGDQNIPEQLIRGRDRLRSNSSSRSRPPIVVLGGQRRSHSPPSRSCTPPIIILGSLNRYAVSSSRSRTPPPVLIVGEPSRRRSISPGSNGFYGPSFAQGDLVDRVAGLVIEQTQSIKDHINVEISRVQTELMNTLLNMTTTLLNAQSQEARLASEVREVSSEVQDLKIGVTQILREVEGLKENMQEGMGMEVRDLIGCVNAARVEVAREVREIREERERPANGGFDNNTDDDEERDTMTEKETRIERNAKDKGKKRAVEQEERLMQTDEDDLAKKREERAKRCTEMMARRSSLQMTMNRESNVFTGDASNRFSLWRRPVSAPSSRSASRSHSRSRPRSPLPSSPHRHPLPPPPAPPHPPHGFLPILPPPPPPMFPSAYNPYYHAPLPPPPPMSCLPPPPPPHLRSRMSIPILPPQPPPSIPHILPPPTRTQSPQPSRPMPHPPSKTPSPPPPQYGPRGYPMPPPLHHGYSFYHGHHGHHMVPPPPPPHPVPPPPHGHGPLPPPPPGRQSHLNHGLPPRPFPPPHVLRQWTEGCMRPPPPHLRNGDGHGFGRHGFAPYVPGGMRRGAGMRGQPENDQGEEIPMMQLSQQEVPASTEAEAPTSTTVATQPQPQPQGYADPPVTQRELITDPRKELEDAKKTYREKKAEFRRSRDEAKRRAAGVRERTRNARFLGAVAGSPPRLPSLRLSAPGIGEATISSAQVESEEQGDANENANGGIGNVPAPVPALAENQNEREGQVVEESSSEDELPEMHGPPILPVGFERSPESIRSLREAVLQAPPLDRSREPDVPQPAVPFVAPTRRPNPFHQGLHRGRWNTITSDPTAIPGSLRRATEESRIVNLITQRLQNMGYSTSVHPHLLPLIMREVRRAALMPDNPVNEDAILQRVINEFYGEVLSRPASASHNVNPGPSSPVEAQEVPGLRRWGTWHGHRNQNDFTTWVPAPTPGRWGTMPGGLGN